MIKKLIQSVVFASLFLGSALAYADSYDRFFRALRLDDGRVVGDLLARGFDVNASSERGDPPLVMALRDGHLEAAEVLFRHPDLKVDAPNVSNETALMMACLRGLRAWVPRLIERGAAVNRSGWSPLLYAASGGDAEIVRLLLKAGADLNARNPAGSTPLIMAARFGSEDVVMALLEAGADPAARNPGGQDAAAAARWAGREQLADALEQRAAGRRGPRLF